VVCGRGAQLVAAFVVPPVGAPGALTADHFVDRAESWDAGSDYDDVGFDSMRESADVLL
jgi:hypothetical protein